LGFEAAYPVPAKISTYALRRAAALSIAACC